MTSTPPRSHKFNAKPQNVTSGALAGYRFDSKGERERAETLKLMERAGEISDLEFQCKVHLVADINWKLDFRYRDNRLGEVVYEDFKGMETPVYRLKYKLWKEFGEGRLIITKKNSGGHIVTTDIVTPATMKGKR